jgi:hypothetical protein
MAGSEAKDTMHVRLTQLDGELPNLALMKLAHWHRARGDQVTVTRSIERDLFEPAYGRVYGSAIFGFSQLRLMRFMRQWPDSIVGGTGTTNVQTVEELIGDEYEHYDYEGWPEVDYSIGFLQRGCRLSCKFCVVPKKEGKPRSTNTVANLWRGAPHSRKLHILDNDFFGNPEWRERVAEIREGKFRVCLSQGINTRLIDDEAAEALATIEYRDTKFQRRRLYTAWDNLKDEERFFAGVDRLERAGVPPTNLMAYMLIGYDKNETWPRLWHRFNRMVERGVKPYPMVFDRSRRDLLAFQRWVLTGLYRIVPWSEFEHDAKTDESVAAHAAAI